MEDLFPGIQLDKAGYPELEAAINKQVMILLVHSPMTNERQSDYLCGINMVGIPIINTIESLPTARMSFLNEGEKNGCNVLVSLQYCHLNS